MMSQIIQNNIKKFDFIRKEKFYKELLSSFKSNSKTNIRTLSGSLKSIIIGLAFNEKRYNYLVLCHSREEALDWYHDLKLLIDENQIAYLIEPKKHKKINVNIEDDHFGWLIEGLSKIKTNLNSITISTPDIFNIPLPDSNQLSINKISIKVGQTLSFIDFSQDLSLAGFERRDFVAIEGEISIRGGILDVFPIGFSNPIRLEFWGDELESIREFDVTSQRSIKVYEEIEFIAKVFHSANTNSNTTLLSYLTEDTVIVLDNPEILFNEEILLPDLSKFCKIEINGLKKADIELKSERQPSLKSSLVNIKSILTNYLQHNFKILICADGKIHLQRIKDLIEAILEEDSDLYHFKDKIKTNVLWLNETPSLGFLLPNSAIACFTEHEIFERMRVLDSTDAHRKKPGGITLKELSELQYGDIVAHEDKGICRFEGFKSVRIGDSDQDCIRLVFDGGDILYVNLNYIHKIHKYSANDEFIPSLSKLGTNDWSKKKEKTKKKLKEIAGDLIKLYAQRKMQLGFQFSIDNTWQKEFEASFIYEDTIDQARTTLEVKKDMESETPMDRLVCGDVGFGKTEIAIRAAFKAVQSSKQVAILVPTTILAQQHFMSFKDRLSRYPVNVDLLSRFRTKAQQTETLKKLDEGKVDILIGTHRILSKDVKFKDLGLLVIDEEQRFGVASKEKLRELRVSIDTLTLTATPIPRTLNFSLMGARDLSIIETPPRNRLPVNTEIIEWNVKEVLEAIETETSRGGQVYIVNDRIEGLNTLMIELNMNMPNLSFAVAHGQLTPSEIEKIMQHFISGKVDVLITTKIVESGLDIPNANTMIINNAHHFGLAELYQLRGRVGRSNIQAFCYLAVPSARTLTKVSVQRLQAIEEFTDLGSGFQLAMRDMEIRGAGNLLGAEQSGAMIDIGFELYQKILEETVNELKNNEFRDVFNDLHKINVSAFENQEIAIEINSDALLPSSYIKSDRERFAYYKKLYALRNNTELEELTKELVDKFGKLPKEGKELIFAVKLRITAVASGFEKVVLKPNKMVCELPNKDKKNYYEVVFPEILEFINDTENSKLIQLKDKLIWEVGIKSRENAIEILWKLKKIIELLND
ncbi:MAG: transcription-repair coupling factor [Candidatus Kapabacteria bacterium]|nr:transcription-repair coupling factor [Candidatus Kapabacteria bacterium]